MLATMYKFFCVYVLLLRALTEGMLASISSMSYSDIIRFQTRYNCTPHFLLLTHTDRRMGECCLVLYNFRRRDRKL